MPSTGYGLRCLGCGQEVAVTMPDTAVQVPGVVDHEVELFEALAALDSPLGP